MTREPSRPPFDEQDADTARRYLEGRGFTAFDPFAAESPAEDMIFTTSLAGARQIFAESFRTCTASGRAFRGYPLFVDRSSRNAFAVEYEGLHVCGVHVGLVVALFEISLFVFAQPALFPEMGDPSGECPPTLAEGTTLSFLISDRVKTEMAGGSPVPAFEFVPRDANRQLGAHFLTQLMLRFVWLHELYHGLNGHGGLLVALHRGMALNDMPDDGTASMVETAQDAIDPKLRLALHCMEFDADRTALWAMVQIQEAEEEPITGLAALPKPLRLKLVLFAAILMTFLFDQSARRRAGVSGGTHPLPYHRLHNLVRTLASNLLDTSGATQAALDAVLNEMTELRKQVPELFSPAQLLHDLRAPDLQGEFDRIEDALNTARGQFASFAFYQIVH